jgi:hypothetical protein
LSHTKSITGFLARFVDHFLNWWTGDLEEASVGDPVAVADLDSLSAGGVGGKDHNEPVVSLAKDVQAEGLGNA